jgi:predicted phosphate transport protein (TIGR00153 family)
VALRITPRDSAFFTLFTEAGRNVADAADVLVQLLDPAADRAAVAAAMRELEHAGDTITHNVYRQLNQSFVTPFDREDIYRLAAALDDVVDAMEEATDFLVVADVGPLPDLMLDQIRLVRLAAHETAQAMPRLRSMKELEPYWIEVNRLENEADSAQRKLLSLLFSGRYKTMLVLKLREVSDLLEEAADALEHVANAVENIALKES